MFFTFKDLEKELAQMESDKQSMTISSREKDLPYRTSSLRELSSRKTLHYQFDSRLVEKDDIFIALKGDRADGHDYLKEVAAKGAFGSIVDKDYKGEDFGLKLYRVESVLEALHFLAKREMEKKTCRVIAVTGSVGKTTTKEFLYTILSGRYSVSRNPKSFNSQVGLASSILNMPKQQDIVLLELGMSEKNEMEKLGSIVKPDIAVFTPIGLVHAGNFNGVEEIVREKTKMRSKERTKVTIAPFELLKYEDIFPKKQTITYSIKDKNADYFLYTEKDRIVISGKDEAVFPKVFEETHFLQNFLAAYAVAKELSMKNEEIEKRLGFLKASPLRFEKVLKNGVLYIQDCYNANSLSMIAALENLPSVKGKKIAVLGAMGELGKYSKECHESVGEAAAKKIDVLLCFGKDSKYILEKFNEGKKNSSGSSTISFYFDDLFELKAKLEEIVRQEDLVLVKGSRFLQMERILPS